MLIPGAKFNEGRDKLFFFYSTIYCRGSIRL